MWYFVINGSYKNTDIFGFSQNNRLGLKPKMGQFIEYRLKDEPSANIAQKMIKIRLWVNKFIFIEITFKTLIFPLINSCRVL